MNEQPTDKTAHVPRERRAVPGRVDIEHAHIGIHDWFIDPADGPPFTLEELAGEAAKAGTLWMHQHTCPRPPRLWPKVLAGGLVGTALGSLLRGVHRA